MATYILAPFPEKGRDYGQGSTVFERDGENWFKAGESEFNVPLSTDRLKWGLSNYGNSAEAAGLVEGWNGSRSYTLKFRLDMSTVQDEGSFGWTFCLRTTSSSSSSGRYYHHYTFTKAMLVQYGATGEVEITLRYVNVGLGSTYSFDGTNDRVQLFINGNLAEESRRISSNTITNEGRLSASRGVSGVGLQIPANTVISAPICVLSNTDVAENPPAWLLRPAKVVNLEPTTQVEVEGTELAITSQQLVDGFSTVDSSQVRFDTNFQPIEGARYMSIMGFGYARYARRSPKNGVATVTPRAGNGRTGSTSALNHYSDNSTATRPLTLLNVGVTTNTRIDGHVQFSDTSNSDNFSVVGLDCLISQQVL